MSDYPLNPTYDSNSPTGMYVPVDVEDCIRELNKILPDALIEKIRTSQEHDLALFHFGLEMWMRNSWGLWLEESRLIQRTAIDFRHALETEFSGAFFDVVFAITDWSPERKFLGPFRDVFTP